MSEKKKKDNGKVVKHCLGNESDNENNSIIVQDSQVIDVNPEQVQKIIDGLPNESRMVLRAFVARIRYSGPIPPPEHLEGYKRTIENGPDRIIAMAEKEQSHRHDKERKIIKQNGVGQYLGFFLAILFGLGAFFLAINGHGSAIAGLMLSPIVALAIIFVLRERPRKSGIEIEE